MATGVLHTTSMPIGEPTHNTEAKEDNKGDTGEPEKREGNRPEEREKGEGQIKTFLKKTLYKPLNPHNNPRPIYNKTHHFPQIKNPHVTHKFGLMCKPPFSSQWIFDCGATDTMTFDPCDLLSTNPKTRTYIQTANGKCEC